MRKEMIPVAVLWLASVGAGAARAVEVDISAEALSRVIARQMFTEDGRRYVRGSKNARCHFAYLENPKLKAAGNRLQVEARFSGRSAWNLMGQCVGLGDSFDVTILGRPYCRNGALAFTDVSVHSNGHKGFYAGQVVKRLEKTLGTTFELKIDQEAERLLGQPRPGDIVTRKVDGFSLTGVRIEGDRIILNADFRVTVR
jgi:hypothetical protein